MIFGLLQWLRRLRGLGSPSRAAPSVLLVAFHYPPQGESSGVQRTLSLANDMAERGWRPIVLSVTPIAYRRTREDQLGDIHPGVKVYRAFAVDVSRGLAIRGKYPRFIALPDVWSSWFVSGLIVGCWLVARYRPQFVWSTYPVATAHLLGAGLAYIARKPWIADFRDSMTEDGYPTDATQRRVYLWIERRTIAFATRCVFTTGGTLAIYSERYPEQSVKFRVIPNGYVEKYFQHLQRPTYAYGRGPVTLVHSGVIYPGDRDPSSFFEAIGKLKAHGFDSTRLRIILRASSFDDVLRPMIAKLDIGDVVDLAPSIEYRKALTEMVKVDGLLVLQASSCNHQIPAKVYEYVRSGTPIIGLTDPVGDTAALLREIGSEWIAPLKDAASIVTLLTEFVARVEEGRLSWIIAGDVERFSRKWHAEILEQLAGEIRDRPCCD